MLVTPDWLHIRGRWMTMTTATRCVHHVSLADACLPCADTGTLSSFSDAQLMAECDRRQMFMPVAVEPMPEEPPAVGPLKAEKPAKKARK